MKLPPLPDAGHPMLQWAPDAQHDLRAYGLACARAALEQAARECEAEYSVEGIAQRCAAAIRAMAKEIT